MSDTNRHITPRRLPGSAQRAPLMGAPSAVPSNRVEALRKLVDAGQYQVSPKWLALRIFKAAGVTIPE